MSISRSAASLINRPASARRRAEAGVAPVVVGVAVAAIAGGVLTGVIWGPIEAAAKAVAGIADGVVGMLPDAADLGLEVPDGWILGYAWANTFLPIAEGLAFALVLLAAIVAVAAVRIAIIVYHLLPKPGMGT